MLAAFGIVFLFTYVGMKTELFGWDGRSIWMFKAKIFYFKNDIGAVSEFRRPELFFLNPDYPVFLPVLATAFAKVNGYWNDFVPKLALLMFPFAFIFWTMSSSRGVWDFSAKALFLTSLMSEHLWNGQADCAFALVGLAAVVSFQRAFEQRCQHWFQTGVTFLTVALSVKLESIFLGVGVLTAIFILNWKNLNFLKWRHLTGGLLGVFAFCFWRWITYKEQLANFYVLESASASWPARFQRLIHFSTYETIVRCFFLDPRMVSVLLTFILFGIGYAWKFGRKETRAIIFKENFFVLVALFVYIICLVLIWLFTPRDYLIYVSSSARRLALFPAAVILWIVLDSFLRFSNDSKISLRTAP
jgi:hypothetical protein